MNKLLTIIVPTYNMEDYLDKCLTSLIVGEADSELMQKLEVLVVNDGSTDRSSEIANNYEERYPYTFKIIDKTNGNYGSCINTALPVATGKYIKILDADDWFDTVAFKDYLVWLEDKDVDAVITNCNVVRSGSTKLFHDYAIETYRILSFYEHYDKLLKLQMHEITYKLSIFEGLEYHQTEGIFYTDNEWTYLPLAAINTFIYYPKVIYCYLLGRPDQSMASVVRNENIGMFINNMFTYIDIYEFCRKKCGNRNGTRVNMEFLRKKCISYVTYSYLLMVKKLKDPEYEKKYKQIDKRIFHEYPDLYKEIDAFVYPSEDFKPPHLSFHIFRSWRKYGNTITSIQLWLINHCNGLLYRTYRIFNA